MNACEKVGSEWQRSEGEKTSRFAVWLLAVFSLPWSAGAQSIQFDAIPLVPCQDVHQENFDHAYPGETLVEARCQVSVLTADGSGEGLTECLFHFYSPEDTIRIHDYSPKTSLVTDVVGNVRVSREQEQRRGLEFTARTQLEGLGQMQVGGQAQGRGEVTLLYDQLPPRETLAAVGTLGRGAGVYFKQRRTSQTSLEGSREFHLVLRVPQQWRAGYLRLVSQARGGGGTLDRSERSLASASFLIPLYRAGDSQAKAAARQLLMMEQALVAEAAQRQSQWKKAQRPSVMHELALADPRFPDHWLSLLLRQAAQEPPLDFESRLPRELLPLIESYRLAKRTVYEFSWGGASAGTSDQAQDPPSVSVQLLTPMAVAHSATE